jgi:hypothetical protein
MITSHYSTERQGIYGDLHRITFDDGNRLGNALSIMFFQGNLHVAYIDKGVTSVGRYRYHSRGPATPALDALRAAVMADDMPAAIILDYIEEHIDPRLRDARTVVGA